MSKRNKPLYVVAQKDHGDDCGPFVLTRTHMKPRRNAHDYMRCISRKNVLSALNNADLTHVSCTDIPDNEGITAEWKIERNPDGSINVGCTSFSREAVAKIRKWAEGVSA